MLKENVVLVGADLSDIKAKKGIIAIGKVYMDSFIICIDESITDKNDKERVKQDLINKLHKEKRNIYVCYEH